MMVMVMMIDGSHCSKGRRIRRFFVVVIVVVVIFVVFLDKKVVEFVSMAQRNI